MRRTQLIFPLTGFVILFTIYNYRSYLQDKKYSFVTQQKQPEAHQLRKELEAEPNVKSSIQCEDCTKQFNDGIKIETKKVDRINSMTKKREIWISMGLCFSKNTEMYGKEKYPYAEVTPLALILWYHFFPDIRVILYLIYDADEIEDRRKLYEEQLKQTNVEIRWVKSGDMSCVTKSQIIRMWAFQEQMINDEDIIITVDVNLFVVGPQILEPIHENPNVKIWVFQWHNAAFIDTGIGETFNQNLMAAESRGIYAIGLLYIFVFVNFRRNKTLIFDEINIFVLVF